MYPENEHVKCLIIGSGPAGYTAAAHLMVADEVKPYSLIMLNNGKKAIP